MLGRENEVVTVGGAKEALHIIEKDARFSVIICDLMMPHMDGPSFYEALGDYHPELQDRVLFCTGGTFTEKSQKFISLMQHRVVRKPINWKSLRSLVNDLCNR